jgi:DNA-binding transcriptional LysR family regulator
VVSPALDAGLVAFKARYPAVELVLESAPWDQIIDAVLSLDAAVAVGFDEDPRPELHHVTLMRERLQLYCGPNHALFGRSADDPAALADENFITFSDGEPPALREFRQCYGLGSRIGGVADNIYEASWLIGLGIGIGHLPEPMVARFAPYLCPLLPAALVPELDIYLMWRKDMQDRAACMLVETILAEVAQV